MHTAASILWALRYQNSKISLLRPHTCISLVKQCGSIKALKSVHASMLRAHLPLDLLISTNLITQYASLGSISYACTLFNACQKPDLFLWNVMVRGFVENGIYDRAVLLYRQMHENGIKPDNFTFPFLFKASGKLKDLELARKIHRDVFKLGYQSDVFVANSLIAVYAKCECFEASRQLFDKMPARNTVSWNSMIGAYAHNDCYEEGLLLFSLMLEERIRPNRASILNVMPCVLGENEADKFFATVVRNKLHLDPSIQTAAIGMYSRCGRVDIARKFFDGILHKDLVAWSSMIEAYAEAYMPFEAVELFKQMKLREIRPDFVTLLGVVRACSNLASWQQARSVHGLIIRSSYGHETEVEAAVIDLYVKCGNLEYGRRVFDRMQDRNLIAWSTMISGYGMHGHGKEALSLFDQMKDLMNPDHIAFVSILSACSHSGLIEEGWRCFKSMARDYGITPWTEHYACMVDLLGRAGQLNEARVLIQKMPMKPDSGVWGTLLGACGIHLEVELAESAAKSLFDLEKESPGRYVLFSNIYTSSGRRERANRIRAMMRHNGVRKIAGHTIIEVGNKMHKFVAG